MIRLDGSQITEKQAAKELFFAKGEQSTLLNAQDLCHAIGVKKLTDKQEAKVKSFLEATRVRVKRFLKI